MRLIFRILASVLIIHVLAISLFIFIGRLNTGTTVIAYTLTDTVLNSRVMLLDINTGIQSDISSNVAVGDISGRRPRWSPDGNQLAFWTHHNRRDSFVYNLRWSDYTTHNLSEESGYPSIPIFHPNGQISFSSNPRFNNADLFLLNEQNQDSELLVEHLMGEPQWSPDGRYLAYLAAPNIDVDESISAGDDIDPNELNVYILELETGEISNLTETTEAAGHPIWSPDSTQIAFISETWNIGQINIIDIRTNKISILSIRDATGIPQWSPKGDSLVFAAYSEGINLEIFVWGLERGEALNISNNPTYDLQPVWSPDGNKIIFVSRRGSQDDLYMYDMETGTLQQVTFTPENESDPAWRP